MENFDPQKHWENIYNTKELSEVSWYQPVPSTSLAFVKEFNIPFTAKIIDIGGGDSFFVDHLLDIGYQDITVLDISETAINRAKNRLGNRSGMVKWIVADAANFNPAEKYHFWHDRAAFHFLIHEHDIENYIESLKKGLHENGVVVLGTFSENGPTKCSGIEITRYSEESIATRFSKYFEKIYCIEVDHKTPFETVQNFVFCCFRKINSNT